MMATAFMGYVLPWGQMSYWGATVITNLFSAIPFVGESIVTWLWGGFSVANPTPPFSFFFPASWPMHTKKLTTINVIGQYVSTYIRTYVPTFKQLYLEVNVNVRERIIGR